MDFAVSEDFLARPRDDPKGQNSGLFEHSLKTAYKAKEIAASLSDEELANTAFYAGLLHDVGKLNPYYQILFSSGWVDGDYLRAHAIFSALAVHWLANTAAFSKRTQKQILFAVAGHHTKLTQFAKSLAFIENDKTLFERSFKDTYNNLYRFSQTVRELKEFKDLDWDYCLSKFKNPIPRIPQEPDYTVDEGNSFVEDFLDFSSVFSALIQADRGSFFEKFPQPAFGISLNTGVLVRTGSDASLPKIRTNFQERLLLNNKFEDNLLILKAPTGIGKTKIFLDIVNKFLASPSRRFERVFYFSPLLALTDDFEGKLYTDNAVSVLNQADAEKVLVYNHAFKGSLPKKRSSNDSCISLDEEAENTEFFKTPEYFERESFNKELIITTTQRLLMVLYSNEVSEKKKLLSFKNSFLIIDEVQTIPKVLLPNLIALLKVLTKKYHSKILLVSATIPDELLGLPMVATPDDVEEQYLQMTAKRIEYMEVLDANREVPLLRVDERVLFMFNTRRKALCFFEKVSELKPDAVYLSTGIRKRDREKIIENLHGSTPATVVSTQVLEAGVDVSFSRMYREMAPLDNIVQAMGRLNRECERSDPLLTVFRLLDNNHMPYSELEVEESKKRIPQLHSSKDLYDALSDYYKTVSSENLTNKNLAKNLDDYMKRLNFDDVWKFVKDHALPLELGDSLLVPDPQDFEKIKKDFLSSDSNKGLGKIYTHYAKLMAQLPGSIEKINGLEDLLDEELLEVGVLFPKEKALGEVYDSKVGLDKWVKKT
ncbi:MAG: CRISPR-associated helicase Cas3' [Candidatus Bathyarchaeota archaeon]|nr:CRISPR-associated helicase Cas3' [Candidatus Bathyarchaeota archaeon]